MKNYDTLLDALKDIVERGYTEDFNIDDENDALEDREKKIKMTADEFEIDEFHRFEGATNPSDMSILYAISSPKFNIKGSLVSAYGTYSENQAPTVLAKLHHYQVNKNL
ncbi:phosphoribosylpyrophosphate synthetase [Mucilaginibacter arboris]|uniref:Phosphoribosylpyrophosphate synthetase n=1 Tax=Mucilaginibacter arboris TaxID=2682090 RepID=A0A7K1SX63_9SPHI|nr:phosphoribosylpyrophosphate synthetase [Mucilaginibacter arboris]MVN21902.1 phosphoribosylpyrophosphate synthetase [Mucilaginibacter arboris]